MNTFMLFGNDQGNRETTFTCKGAKRSYFASSVHRESNQVAGLRGSASIVFSASGVASDFFGIRRALLFFVTTQ